jgi:hypothetical protein
MVEGTIELLFDLFLTVLSLVITSCIVGSIIVALRAVRRVRADVSVNPLV